MRCRPYLELLRPPLAPMDLALPAAAALLSAYAVTGGLPEALSFLIATVGAYAAITSSYVYNDYCDVDVDRVGMPGRPLPSSRVTAKEAGLYSLFLFLVACTCALYLNPESFVVLIAATILITIYSRWAKRHTPFSWILVGLSFGLVPLGVWLAISPAGILKAGIGLHPAALVLSAMICITDWAFTNCDASRDVAGDRAKGIPTLPATYGIPVTSKLVLAIWLAGLALSLLLGTTAGLGWLYMAGAALAGSWLVYQAWQFAREPTAPRGDLLFYQSANYRAVLFAVLILDILFRAVTGPL
ncbi:MAG: UbiA family prenyltransferase [Methanotrichaceae archaeon]|nr:UbiA family prenyltransferase [Methanotrichaceae archaeon]